MPDLRGRGGLLTAVAVTVMLAATGCARDDQTPDSSATPAAGTVAATVAELCMAATTDQEADAIQRFQTVHGPLHDLADQTAQSDRTVAARLLETKQRVESAIGDDDAGAIPDLFVALARAAVDALGPLDVPVPAACDALEQQS